MSGTVGKRRILLAATEFSTGGLGSYLVTLAEGLSTRGWEVHLLATSRLGDLWNAVGEALPRHDLSGVPLSMDKVRRTAGLLKRIAPETLLLNHAALVHYALPLLETVVRPFAVIHSDDPRFFSTAALFQHRVLGWVAPSRGIAERFAPALPAGRRSRVRVIPHGVDPLFCPNPTDRRPRGDEGVSRDGVRVIFVGFLGHTKGADLLPGIMRRVWSACPGARLTVVGAGPLRAEVEGMFAAAGDIPGRWRFTGAVARDEVARLLRESDLLLLPTTIEGFGLTIPEAMLSGCVPVVSRLAGVTDEIVDSGRTGFLVDPGDGAGFADVVIRMAKDPALRCAIAAAGRADAESRFSTGRMLEAYEALFDWEDDRERPQRRSPAGWAVESAHEVLRRGLDPRWLGRRVREIVRRPR